MARKKHRRHARRRNPVAVRRHVVRHRRRHRRNPPLMGGVMGLVKSGVSDGAFGLAGNFTTRYVSGMLGTVGTGYTGYLVEAGLGVVGAMVLRKMSPGGARAFLQGAFMAPMSQLAKSVLPASMSMYLGDAELTTQYNAGIPGGGFNNGGLDPAVQTGQTHIGELQGYAGYAGYPGLNGYAGYAEDSMGDFDSMAGQYGRR